MINLITKTHETSMSNFDTQRNDY